ncbi:Asp23/Gls24 family envelope stress response protein [Actinomadura parmotrematis]|uniref:Asp23/Gls24 family envelope stress response protein n=1 Tax=Actinomadura parmotrematis TaxID=2864039 RepID=A0ABS7FTV0_9ACTN|nr:Asp23/Gls24 family envelope stress response protein [Actinomadura parmotrematis]MBW8483802.1 Asp23/Gls24 family envelope stress response protein [Actinomadura parmotrematis]
MSGAELSGPGRGTTTIADRVVARIAAYAAGTCEETGGAQRRVLGVPMGGSGTANTDVHVRGDIVTARVELTVAYPAPVRAVAREVRERVRRQIERQTGLTVRQVDVEVAALERAVPAQRTAREPAGVR